MEIEEIEFYTFENEVWYKKEDKNIKLVESNRELIKQMIEVLQTFYPKAFECLENHYSKLSWNRPLQEYRIIRQFCKCNFGNLDIYNVDIDDKKTFNFENIPCPMRGECKMENIVCHPQFNSMLSTAEKRVAKLISKGKSNDEIASLLFISSNTVRGHLRHIYKKLNINSRHELMSYCNSNNLFKRYECEESI